MNSASVWRKNTTSGRQLAPQQRLVHGFWSAAQDTKWLVADLVTVAIRTMEHVASPPFPHTREVRQLVRESRRDQQSARGHGAPVVQSYAETVDGGLHPTNGGRDNPRAISEHLGAPHRQQFSGRHAVARQEIVHVRGGRVTRVARIHNNDSAARPGQHDRRAETGCAATDNRHIVLVRSHLGTSSEPGLNALPSAGIPALGQPTCAVVIECLRSARLGRPDEFVRRCSGWL